jgi:hypothetical protein
MATTNTNQEVTAMRLVVQAINLRHRTTYPTDEDALRTMFAVVKKAPEYNTVFFLKPADTHEIACLCISSRKRIKDNKRGHTRDSGSYTAVVSTGKVVRMCFNSKCKKRCGGKTILVEHQQEDTSDDDSDFVSTDDDEPDDDDTSVGNKRQRAD